MPTSYYLDPAPHLWLVLTSYRLIPCPYNTGHIQLVLTYIAAPVEDGTDTVFRNVSL